jgi:hypothetical protein
LAQVLECGAEQRFEGFGVGVCVGGGFGNGATGVGFFGTHAFESCENLGRGVRSWRRKECPVVRAVGMAKLEARRCGSFHDEAPLVTGAVVCGAQDDELFRSVSAAVGAWGYVVNVDVDGVATAGYGAAAAMSAEHVAADGGWDGLGCAAFALWRGAESLRVAFGHLDDLGRYRERSTLAVLHGAPALLTNRELDSITRAPGVRTAHRVSRHEQDGVVLAERAGGFAAKLGESFAEGRERFGAELEAKDVAAGYFVGRVGGGVAGSAAADELFDFAQAAAFRGGQPARFGRFGGHS